MKHSQLDAMLAESGFDPDDVDQLTVVLGPLAELTDEVPAPTAQLLALFGEQAPDGAAAQTPRVAPIRRARNRSMVASAVVLALSGVGATGLSAAANTLPSPWQRQVSNFSRHYLPFNFPEPTVKIPHLAKAPESPGTTEERSEVDPEVRAARLRAAEEISRSLTRPRPRIKAARGWSARHRDQGQRPADGATYSTARASHPSASSSASSTPGNAGSSSATPNTVKGSSPTYAPASPAKTASIRPGTGKPGSENSPSKGSGNPVKGGPATDSGTGPQTPPATDPDPGVVIPDLPDLGIPIEGGPVLDRVTPEVESDAGDS